MTRRPRVTWTLAALCLLVFALHGLRAGWGVLQYPTDPLSASLYLWPFESPRFRIWQLLSYGFEHGSLQHLALNLLGLMVFGSELEHAFGGRRVLLIFLGSLLLAGFSQQVLSSWLGHAAPIVGASGGVFGLLVAFARAFPRAEILVFPVPFPLHARTVALGFAVLELAAAAPLGFGWWLAMNRWFGGIAHYAHLGGMLGGLLFSLPPPPPPEADHDRDSDSLPPA